jgi:hypothetical protein
MRTADQIRCECFCGPWILRRIGFDANIVIGLEWEDAIQVHSGTRICDCRSIRVDTPIGQTLIVADSEGNLRVVDWADHEARDAPLASASLWRPRI